MADTTRFALDATTCPGPGRPAWSASSPRPTTRAAAPASPCGPTKLRFASTGRSPPASATRVPADLRGRGRARDRLVHAPARGHRGRGRRATRSRPVVPRSQRPSSRRWPACTRRVGRHPDLAGREWLNRATPESDGFLVRAGGLVAARLPRALRGHPGARAPRPSAGSSPSSCPPICGLHTGPRTTSHGDFRLDNLLFQPGHPRPVVVDWQTAALGRSVPRRGVLHRRLPQHRGPAGPRGRPAGPLPRRAVPGRGARLLAGAAAARTPGWTASGASSWPSWRAMVVQRTERGDLMFLTSTTRHAQHALDVDAPALLLAAG